MSIVSDFRKTLRAVKKMVQLRKRIKHALFIRKLKTAALGRYAFENKAAVNRYKDINEQRFLLAAVALPGNTADLVLSFVLLQYNQYDFTRKALDSILQLRSPCKVHVVIVDNGSTAPGRDSIETAYASSENIHFINTGENLGFARGNNVGYSYAKKTLNSHFIIVANNDVTYPDRDMLENILSFYASSHFAILGPDIQAGKDGNVIHQNPMRRTLRTRKETEQSLRDYEDSLKDIDSMTLKPPQLLGSRKRESRSIGGDVVLHGSAYLFSPAFVMYRDIVFNEKTFLYGEELLLALSAFSEGYKMIYTPKITVIHHAKASTNLENLKKYYTAKAVWHIDASKAYIDCIDTILPGRGK